MQHVTEEWQTVSSGVRLLVKQNRDSSHLGTGALESVNLMHLCSISTHFI